MFFCQPPNDYSPFLSLGICGSSLPSQDRNTLNVPSLDSIQQNPHLGDTCADAADLSGDHTSTSTHDAPLNASAENSALKNKSLDEVGSQSIEPSASGSAEPLGLGGGLIPKVLINEFKCLFYQDSAVVFILMLILSVKSHVWSLLYLIIV